MPDLSNIAKYAVVDNQIYRLLRRFLPGPYTFILDATRDVPKLVQMKRKQVGIRVPNCEAIRALARELGRPIISTTAARPGEEPHVDPHGIDANLSRTCARPRCGGRGAWSRRPVIDLTKTPPEVVREGAGPVDEFLEGWSRAEVDRVAVEAAGLVGEVLVFPAAGIDRVAEEGQ